VMTGSQDRSIILWNPYKELLIRTYAGVHNYEITDLAMTDDNARFISVGGDRSGFVWDVATGKVIRKFGTHHSRINCCSIGGESSILATGGYDCEVRLWDLKDKKATNCIQKIKECKDSVSSVLFNGNELIVSSVDGHIRTFDIRMGHLTEDDLNIGILSFGLSNDQRLITTNCLDSKIRILERDTGQVLTVL
jgi:mitogen-activated protein kinase organizer 1